MPYGLQVWDPNNKLEIGVISYYYQVVYYLLYYY